MIVDCVVKNWTANSRGGLFLLFDTWDSSLKTQKAGHELKDWELNSSPGPASGLEDLG
jgi:hypothetical protein